MLGGGGGGGGGGRSMLQHMKLWIHCRTAKKYGDLKMHFTTCRGIDKPLSKNKNHCHRVSSGLAASNDTMKQTEYCVDIHIM